MKTLVILSSLLMTSILVIGYFNSQEHTESYTEQTFNDLDRRVRKLEREQRMGPKQYCMTHNVGIWTDRQSDSVLVYLSHLTHHELLEVQYGITDNIALRAYIDTIIVFKDSSRQVDDD